MSETKESKTSVQNFRTVAKKEFNNFFAANKAKEMAEAKYKEELESVPPKARLRIRRRENYFDLLLMKRIKEIEDSIKN